MDIFIGIKKDLQRIGFMSFNHPYSKYISFSQYFLIIGLIFIYFLASLWYFVFDAETFIEHIESATPFFSGFFNFLTYSTSIWQHKKIIELIMEYGSIIAERKSHFILIFRLFTF